MLEAGQLELVEFIQWSGVEWSGVEWSELVGELVSWSETCSSVFVSRCYLKLVAEHGDRSGIQRTGNVLC
jgi:hypothetical protein